MMKNSGSPVLLMLSVATILLVACNGGAGTPATFSVFSSETPAPVSQTATSIPPTQIPTPMASVTVERTVAPITLRAIKTFTVTFENTDPMGVCCILNSYIVFSPDAKTLAIGSQHLHYSRSPIKLLDVASGKELMTLAGHDAFVGKMSFSPDGNTLASGGGDELIKLWDVRTGELLRSFASHSGRVRQVAFSPNGKMLASAGEDGTLGLWEAASGLAVRSIETQQGILYSVAYSSNGKMIATAGLDKTIKLWDASTDSELKILRGHSDQVFAVVFNPNGKNLASASLDHIVKLWDVETGKEIRTLSSQLGFSSIAISPQGEILATGGWDKTIRLWDIATGKELDTITSDFKKWGEVAFSPDGNLLVGGDAEDGSITLWQMVR